MIPFMLEALGVVTGVVTKLNNPKSTMLVTPAVATALALGKILTPSLKPTKNVTTYPREKAEILKIFQRNLSNLRSLGGLSVEKIGEILDITRQAIWSLENGKTNITATQYIAWRNILELASTTKLKETKQGNYLQRALHIFTDNILLYSDDELKKYEKILDQLVRAQKAGLDEDIMDTIAQNLPDFKE